MSPDQMPRCRDCRWWYREVPLGVGTCNRPNNPDDRRLFWAYSRNKQGAIFAGFVNTSPDFGCVQFEVKT